jgi:HPt (histidine-containing phosphotransfer) domain-containing protein
MRSHSGSNPFIFSNEIDIQCINELYGDDYAYVEEVFGTVLKEYGMLIENIHSAYLSSDIPALKAAVHKIKPIFGFVGLKAIQQHCQHFENKCQTATTLEGLAGDYQLLSDGLIGSRTLLEGEKKKLELFNGQRS